MPLRTRLSLLGAALAVVALACGGGDGAPDDVDTSGLLPVVSSACEEGTPDCEDTVAVGDEPLFIGDEPDLGVDPGEGSSGFVVDGGLTIEEALSADAEGVIAVRGFIVSDAAGTRLCDLLAESMPPQCGGASVLVSGLDTVDPDELRSAQGVSWTDHAVTILGEIVDGMLVPNPYAL